MSYAMTRRRRFVLLVSGAVLVVAIALFWRSGRDEIEELVVQPAPNATPLPTVQAVSPEERAFYDYVGPRLRSMTAEARELDRMGRERSRDLIGLQVRSDRVFTLATEIDAFVAGTPVPARFAEAVRTYQEAVAEMRAGSEQARTAFFRFDWEAIASGLAVFGAGANTLDAAYASIRDVAGAAATPSASTSLISIRYYE